MWFSLISKMAAWNPGWTLSVWVYQYMFTYNLLYGTIFWWGCFFGVILPVPNSKQFVLIVFVFLKDLHIKTYRLWFFFLNTNFVYVLSWFVHHILTNICKNGQYLQFACFAPLNDVRAYIVWSWKTTLIMWIFYKDNINLIYSGPPGCHLTAKNSESVKIPSFAVCNSILGWQLCYSCDLCAITQYILSAHIICCGVEYFPFSKC